MRKVTVTLEIRIVMSVDEGIKTSEAIRELDCQVTNTTTAADILDAEIVDHEIIDSKLTCHETGIYFYNQLPARFRANTLIK